MATFFSFFTKNQSLIYKVFLYLISTVLVIYLLPKGGNFKYDFQKGKPWQDENLYAPFNFTIKKDKVTLEREEENIRANAAPYFDLNTSISETAAQNFVTLFESSFADSLYRTRKSVARDLGLSILNTSYNVGVIEEVHAFDKDKVIYLKKGNEVREILYSQLFHKEKLSEAISIRVNLVNAKDIESLLQQILERTVTPNVSYNSRLTNTSIEKEIGNINPNRGIVETGERIIAKGEVVEGDKFQILNSLQAKYESDVWSTKNYYWVVLGYSILVSLVFIMLFLFLKKYRNEIFLDNTKVSFIFFNVIFMVFVTTVVVKYDATYIYVIPLCIPTHCFEKFFRCQTWFVCTCAYVVVVGFHCSA